MEIFVVVQKEYNSLTHSFEICDVDNVYLTEDAARERLKELPKYKYADYIKKVVR